MRTNFKLYFNRKYRELIAKGTTLPNIVVDDKNIIIYINDTDVIADTYVDEIVTQTIKINNLFIEYTYDEMLSVLMNRYLMFMENEYLNITKPSNQYDNFENYFKANIDLLGNFNNFIFNQNEKNIKITEIRCLYPKLFVSYFDYGTHVDVLDSDYNKLSRKYKYEVLETSSTMSYELFMPEIISAISHLVLLNRNDVGYSPNTKDTKPEAI